MNAEELETAVINSQATSAMEELLHSFIANSGEPDSYLIGFELTENVIDFIGREKFIEIHTKENVYIPHLPIGFDAAIGFYAENKSLIKEWVEFIASVEKRGKDKTEKLASILGFTSTASKTLQTVLEEDPDELKGDDSRVIVYLINILFGTVNAGFKQYKQQHKQGIG